MTESYDCINAPRSFSAQPFQASHFTRCMCARGSPFFSTQCSVWVACCFPSAFLYSVCRASCKYKKEASVALSHNSIPRQTHWSHAYHAKNKKHRAHNATVFSAFVLLRTRLNWKTSVGQEIRLIFISDTKYSTEKVKSSCSCVSDFFFNLGSVAGLSKLGSLAIWSRWERNSHHAKREWTRLGSRK